MTDFVLPQLNPFGSWGAPKSSCEAAAPLSSSSQVSNSSTVSTPMSPNAPAALPASRSSTGYERDYLNLRGNIWYRAAEVRSERGLTAEEEEQLEERRKHVLDKLFGSNISPERLDAYIRVVKEEDKERKRTEVSRGGRRFFTNTTSDSHDSTIEVENVVDEIEFNSLVNIARQVSLGREDIKMVGLPCKHNAELDGASFESPMALTGTGKDGRELPVAYRGTITGDPVLNEFIENSTDTCPLVICTEDALAHLMAASCSVHPWDIDVRTVQSGRKLVLLQRRSGGQVEAQWVSETAKIPEEIPENNENETDFDSRNNLGTESAKVNSWFQAASRTAKTVNALKTEKIPKTDEEGVYQRRTLYKYLLYKVNNGTPDEFHIAVRAEIDSADVSGEDVTTFLAFGLLEYNSTRLSQKVMQKNKEVAFDWGKTRSVDRILAREKARNNFKITKWICAAHVAQSNIKIGFIRRRLQERGPPLHHLVGIVSDSPDVLARNLQVNLERAWNAIEVIFGTVFGNMTNDAADFSLVRVSGITKLTLMKRDFEEDEDDEDEDEDEDDEDDEEGDDKEEE